MTTRKAKLDSLYAKINLNQLNLQDVFNIIQTDESNPYTVTKQYVRVNLGALTEATLDALFKLQRQ